MKRLKIRQKKYQLYRKRRVERQRSSTRRTYEKKIDLARHHGIVGKPLHPPRDMCLDRDFNGVMRFIAHLKTNLSPNLRKQAKGRPGPPRRGGSVRSAGHVPFEDIETITPAAALLMAAEYDRHRRMQHRTLYSIRRKLWKPSVDAMLVDIGFLKLLGVDKQASGASQPDDRRYRTLSMTSGDQADGRQVGLFQDALSGVLGEDLETEAGMRLYEGLIEAMNNVIQHAYPANYSSPRSVKNRWWLTGSFDRQTGRLHIVFLDHGVSIPAALPRSKWREKALEFLGHMYDIVTLGRSGSDDAERIHAAMEVGRSGTDDQGRGHGLAQMRYFVDKAPAGRMRILSRRGQYLFETGSAKPDLRNHDSPIRGTLIEWECLVMPAGGREQW